MDASSDAMQDLLKALTLKINQSKAVLEAQHIGNALYGLHNMDASSDAMQDLLKALTLKINQSKAVLEAQHIGNALYGLHNMDASSAAMQDLLKALTLKINKSDAILKPQHIGNALYGLHNMSADMSIISQLSEKMPPTFSHLEHPWAWSQACSAYLEIAKNSSHSRRWLEGFLNLFFPDDKISSCTAEDAYEKISSLFTQILKIKHFNKGVLDLHGLDNLSAARLLDAFKNPADEIKSIIFGRSSHSKTSQQGKMKQIVLDYLKTHHINGNWDGGIVTIIQRPQQAPSPFFSFNPSVKPFTPKPPIQAPSSVTIGKPERTTPLQFFSLNPTVEPFTPTRSMQAPAPVAKSEPKR